MTLNSNRNQGKHVLWGYRSGLRLGLSGLQLALGVRWGWCLGLAFGY